MRFFHCSCLWLSILSGCVGPSSQPSDAGGGSAGGGGASGGGQGSTGGSGGGQLGGGAAGGGFGGGGAGGGFSSLGGIFSKPQKPQSFSYRIAKPFTATEAPPYEVIGLDLFGNDAQVVKALKAKGKTVICYFSSQYEEWREDFKKIAADAAQKAAFEALLAGPLDQWPGEQWVDIHNFSGTSALPQHELLRKLLKDRMVLAAQNGCDAVELDNVDEYDQQPKVKNKKGESITAADQYAFNTWLAQLSHQQQLAIFLKNDLAQIADGASAVPAGQPGLANVFDGAINEECFRFDECAPLAPFRALEKPIFVVEYQLAGFPSAAQTKVANDGHLNVSYYDRSPDKALSEHPTKTFGSW
jgi:hypothetical protein